MRILFVCGSLEPGKDGVGDYIRQLCASLMQLGHQVAALSIGDAYVQVPCAGIQDTGSCSLPVFRLPQWQHHSHPGMERWIDSFDPDWLSLQYVPFSFHPKGLHYGLADWLERIGEHRNWHIMFHELWIGMRSFAHPKHYVVGWLQQQLIASLLQKLRPKIVHTHTTLYQLQLARLGCSASYLPIFSNIPFGAMPGKKDSPEDAELCFVSFGTIQKGCRIEQFAAELSGYAAAAKRRVSVVITGRSGPETERWVTVLASKGITVKVPGEQPQAIISAYLAGATAGISSTPISLVEKSGSVAAMKAHGLPVICIAKPWKPLFFNYNQLVASVEAACYGVCAYHPGKLEAFMTNCKSFRNTIFPADIASDFQAALVAPQMPQNAAGPAVIT